MAARTDIEPFRSSTGERTRRAILDAAIATLSRDAATSLGAVARAAGVGRTTLHRYFPDRAALIRALADEASVATQSAFAASALGTGSATEALTRLVHELIALGDRFVFLLREPTLADDPDIAAGEREATETIKSLITRGQASGEFTPKLPAAWIAEAIGALVYGGWLAVEGGTVPRAYAGPLAIRTLLHGIAARE
jgi:TetR/AcrR family transcriptional regulator, repressor for lfrA